jgi:hypothetical protein
VAFALAELPALSVEDEDVAGGFTFTEVDDEELGVVLSAGGLMFVVELVATGGGVVVLGVTTVVESREADGDGVVVEVVVVRSHAARVAPKVRAATRGISFICSPWKFVKPHAEIGGKRGEFHRHHAK